MRNLTIRPIIALITFAMGLSFAAVSPFNATRKSESRVTQNAQPQSENRSEVILRVLMPTGTRGDSSQLDRFDRAEEIQVLREARVDAISYRAIGITFLLAALGEDYETNRRKLIDALKDCAHEPYPQGAECTYLIADYLMELCRRGDASLFELIFDVTNKADGAFAESLGGFYSDMLKDRPEQFLTALALFPKKQRRDLCSAAGSEDGSGMDDARFRRVSQLLNDLSARSGSPGARIARDCLMGVRDGYKKAVANAKSTAQN